MSRINWDDWNKIRKVITGPTLCVGEEKALSEEEVEVINTSLSVCANSLDKIPELFSSAAHKFNNKWKSNKQ